MAKSVVGLFDNMSDAHGAVQELTNAGFTSDNISIVANNASGDTTTYDTTGSEAAEGAGAGAVGGAVLGGLGGLLVGLGALAIPGVGPVIAAGTLATALGTTAVGAGIGAAAGGLVGALVGAGIPEEDANIYAEGIRRGGALVTVQANSDADADRAAEILDRYNVVDIDERGTTYRNAGWTRFDPNDTSYAGSTVDSPRSEWDESSKVGTAGGTLAGAAAGAAIGSVAGPVGTVVGGVAGAVTGAGVGAAADAAGEAASDATLGEDDTRSGYRAASTPAMGATTDYSTTRMDTTSTGFQSGTRDINADQGEVAIPVVEEEIRIGKRAVESGGVRVETRVEETPVNEQVTLRDERVTVERRPVDQTVDAATLTDAFREGTFEVRERDEEAVVQKEARVVEEVVVGKQVEQRTETVQDSVRRTDVDVQQIPGQTRTTGFTETASVRAGDVGGGSVTGSTYSTDTTVSGTSNVDSPRSEWDESSKVGTAGGGLAGAATGAAIGSVAGPVGTVVGGVAGAVTGAGVGAAADAAGEAASDAALGEDDTATGYRSGEGAIESGLSRGENAIERGTGLDLDRDGDTGQRDTRNNF